MASNPAILEPTVQPPLSLSERPDDQGNSAFFYGTLMHPSILRRVIANDGNHLKICSAILFKVMGEKAISDDEKTVRGVVVRGLTAQDIALLDVFEGDVSHDLIRVSAAAGALLDWSLPDLLGVSS
ncbi:mitochondrial Homoaconitase [Tulasnella sp. 330]|nr:mitochondrial Homoaconitase [Tulasnella sp. 330]